MAAAALSADGAGEGLLTGVVGTGATGAARAAPGGLGPGKGLEGTTAAAPAPSLARGATGVPPLGAVGGPALGGFLVTGVAGLGAGGSAGAGDAAGLPACAAIGTAPAVAD